MDLRKEKAKLHIIPSIKDMRRMLSLAETYGCAFEYNDFYTSDMLGDEELQEERIEQYRQSRKDFSADTMHGAFLDVTIHSNDSLIREVSMMRIWQSMEIAERMGLKGVVFHSGRLANFRDSKYLENWQETNEIYFSEIAEDYPKRQIYMENMFDEAPDVLAELAERMKDVPNFGICLDYAHAAISGCPVEEWVRTLAPYIKHIHINDNDLVNDLHQPVGEGKIDWQEYDALMRKYQIKAPVLVEVKGYGEQKRSLEYMKKHGIYPMPAKA